MFGLVCVWLVGWLVLTVLRFDAFASRGHWVVHDNLFGLFFSFCFFFPMPSFASVDCLDELLNATNHIIPFVV